MFVVKELYLSIVTVYTLLRRQLVEIESVVEKGILRELLGTMIS